jgi:hypothetical protein
MYKAKPDISFTHFGGKDYRNSNLKFDFQLAKAYLRQAHISFFLLL